MNVHEQLLKTLDLIKLERQADLDYYRQKVLLRSLHERTQEGTTWYPVKLKRDYIGTGERIILEVERTTHTDHPHAFQSGKSVSIFSNAAATPEKEHANAVVNYVKDNTMVLTLNADELPDWIEDGLLGVDVMFDEMSYREMEYALKEVLKADSGRVARFRELLLSSDGETGKRSEKNVQKYPSELNESQQHAFQMVMQCDDIAFIHGPPGTGKTTTLVYAIAETIREERQVLVCAPSNAAVDLLADKLGELGLEVLRIGHPARVTEQSLSKTLDARISAHPHYQELRELRKKMEKIRSAAFKYKRKFGYYEKEQRRMLLQEARLLKSDADALEFYIVNDLLNKSEAICCTLVGSSHPVMRGKKFRTAFIDEAAQALEPATWIPLLRCERVIFAGDHFQLPPTIKSFEAARQGLAETLFEKGINRHPENASMLQLQYRMHQDIMTFSSQYFYDNSLVADESVKHRLLYEGSQPVEFIDTAGCGFNEEQDPETLSRFNEEEAQLAIRLAENVINESGGVPEWVSRKLKMGIITPYRAQVEHLTKLAEASAILEPLLKIIAIDTVDAFQGQERDVILISFVRSNNEGEVGFLGDIRRTNVAMTRAKTKLVLIGDSATLGSHPFYLELLNWVQNNEYYKSAFELQ